MNISFGLPQICCGVLLLGALQFLLTLWISERLKSSLQKENSIFLEKFKWDIKVREQAAKVAEYMAIAPFLKATDPPQHYERANRLS